jgi:Protein of unknown function (DUF4058)
MPLRDHFQPPLSSQRAWEPFHTHWTSSIAAQLNARLPKRFFAEPQMHLGSQVEADVIEFESLDESLDESEEPPGHDEGGGDAVAAWAPPVATLTIPAVFPDDIEIHVRDEFLDARVVAVVELVSPANKDRPEKRRAFATKSAAYLQSGIGLVTVDIVTSRHFNLHNELLPLLGVDESFAMEEDAQIYAVAYRPIRRNEMDQIDLWPVVLSVGAPLPLLPLSLKRFRPVPLDLEAAYEEACRRGRL